MMYSNGCSDLMQLFDHDTIEATTVKAKQII